MNIHEVLLVLIRRELEREEQVPHGAPPRRLSAEELKTLQDGLEVCQKNIQFISARETFHAD